MADRRTVQLRNGEDRRYFWGYIDDDSNLYIDGQDLGSGTASVSDDGEYEWFSVIESSDVPRVVALLDCDEGEDALSPFERLWTGRRSYELEQRLRDSDIHVDRAVWS